MKNYTNQHIVEDVYRNYKIRGLIIKMISSSFKDKSCDDLEMYIYEQLLLMNNDKLNSMYQDGINTNNPNKKSTKLRNFISQMIYNSRNGGHGGKNTYYVNQLKLNNNEFFFANQDIPDFSGYDFTADIIVDYIDKKSEMDDNLTYTSDELKSILAFTLLKKYFMSDLTQSKLANHLGLSRLTVHKLLKIAKEDILIFWNKKGKYHDDNFNFNTM